VGTGAREITRETLFAAVRGGWSAETSVDPNWSRHNPALGQCAVTALVVQEYLGGDLIRATVGPVSHYWNRLPDAEIDLTRDQFVRFLPGETRIQPREDALANKETHRRYELLRAWVACELGNRGHSG
jgi:hypothetical protein